MPHSKIGESARVRRRNIVMFHIDKVKMESTENDGADVKAQQVYHSGDHNDNQKDGAIVCVNQSLVFRKSKQGYGDVRQKQGYSCQGTSCPADKVSDIEGLLHLDTGTLLRLKLCFWP